MTLDSGQSGGDYYPKADADGWRELFEAVLQERDPDALPERVEQATDAIHARLELSFSGHIPANEAPLIDALRILREIQQAPQQPA